jgi:hypothetical protein
LIDFIWFGLATLFSVQINHWEQPVFWLSFSFKSQPIDRFRSSSKSFTVKTFKRLPQRLSSITGYFPSGSHRRGGAEIINLVYSS